MVVTDLNGSLGNIIIVLTLLFGVVGIIHAFKIREEYLIKLATLQQGIKGSWFVNNHQPPEQSSQNSSNKGSSEMYTEPKSPSPSKKDILIPYGELLEICVKYISDGYFVDEAIPTRKLSNARQYFPVPDTERVIALIDTTIFGSNKLGLAICESGLYWRNDWTVKTNRNFLSWSEFAVSSIASERKPSSTIQLAEGSILNLSGSSFKKDEAAGLLRQMQTLSRTVVERSYESVAPVQESSVGKEMLRSEAEKRPEENSTLSKQSRNPSPSVVPTPTSKRVDDTYQKKARSSESFTLSNYPIPLAYSYRLVEAEFETIRVLKEVYRSSEVLTAFLASLSLALIESPTNSIRKELLNSWRGKGATFGNWFHILEKSTRRIDLERGSLYSSMGQLLDTGDESSFRERMHWLIDRRNELHHSDLPVGVETDRLIAEARECLEQCIVETEPIWQNPLRLVLDYDAIRNSDYVVATCLDYSGDHPIGRKVQENYRGVPKKQDIYILQNESEWIPLYPYISVHYCRHCNTRETYFIDSWAGPGEKAHLRSIERGHEEESSEIGQDLELRLGL